MAAKQSPKAKVLSFGPLHYVDAEKLEQFTSTFDLHIIEPTDRAGTIALVAEAAKTSGPFDAAIIGMGNGRYELFNEELLGPLLPSLKIVACVNAGYSEFDLEWFTKNKIYVTNTLYAVAEPTADITVMLILNTLRDFPKFERLVKTGSWRGAVKVPPTDPHGLLLGIIGMGKIGKHVARKSQAFGMKVQYYNRNQIPAEEEKSLDVTYASLQDLLKTSDVVCVNCPLSDSTRGLIGEAEIASMKDGVFLINTGRGPIIDEKALIQGIWSGKIARAGLDVFDNEPNINPFFRENEKCIVQPHLGSFTNRAWKDAYIECMDNIEGYFLRGKPVSPVNTF
ncbi:hypothetical protein Hte_007141 [Hypoxylon texense]